MCPLVCRGSARVYPVASFADDFRFSERMRLFFPIYCHLSRTSDVLSSWMKLKPNNNCDARGAFKIKCSDERRSDAPLWIFPLDGQKYTTPAGGETGGQSRFISRCEIDE